MKKPKKPKKSASMQTLKNFQKKLKEYNDFMRIYKTL